MEDMKEPGAVLVVVGFLGLVIDIAEPSAGSYLWVTALPQDVEPGDGGVNSVPEGEGKTLFHWAFIHAKRSWGRS